MQRILAPEFYVNSSMLITEISSHKLGRRMSCSGCNSGSIKLLPNFSVSSPRLSHFLELSSFKSVRFKTNKSQNWKLWQISIPKPIWLISNWQILMLTSLETEMIFVKCFKLSLLVQTRKNLQEKLSKTCRWKSLTAFQKW